MTDDAEQEAFEALQRMLRTGLSAATQVAQRIARAREQEIREAQAHSEQRTAELSARLLAERSVAAASVQVINREEFWVSATPEDVCRVYATAHAWESIDPQLGAAAATIREEVRERYGLDVADLAIVDQLHDDSAGQRTEAREQRHLEQVASDAAVVAATDGGEEAIAEEEYQQAMQARAAALATTAEDQAGALDNAAVSAVSGDPTSNSGEAAGIDYDSRRRRDALAQQLEGVAPPDAVAARVLADTGQAKSARLAVSTQPTRPRQGAKTAGLANPQQLGPEHRRSH